MFHDAMVALTERRIMVMKKIISFFGILVTIVLLTGLNPNSANAEDTWTYTYTYDNIPSRTVSYALVGDHPNYLDFTVDGTAYKITSEYKVTDAFCDKYGTVWSSLLSDSDILYLGFYNFELQGTEDPVFHITRIGIVGTSDTDWSAIYGADMPNTFWTLPNVDELSNYLSTGELNYNYIPNPYFNPTPVPATPEPARTTSPTENPVPTEPSLTEAPVQPSSTPAANPSSIPTSKPIPTTSTPVDSSTTPATVGKPASVVKKGSTIFLTDSNGNIIKTFTLKAGKLTVNKKVIKNVKSSYFTKKGTVVYLTKSGKAYYINSKDKSKLIQARVKQVKTTKGFAVKFKLKNGRVLKIKV